LQRHIANLVGENPCALERLDRRWRGVALIGDKCLTELQVQGTFALAPAESVA